MFLSMFPMLFRKVYLSFEELGADVSMSLRQLQIGLSESWKLCLNLCSRRWLKSNLNLVNNFTPLGLWQLKQCFQKDVWSLKMFSWRHSSLLNCEYLGPALFHWITAEGKKEFWKKLWFILNRGILLVFLVLYVLTEIGIILNRHFGHFYLKILQKETQFSAPSSFFKGLQT